MVCFQLKVKVTLNWVFRMAPEVALQDPYDKSADVFSYGMVLYEILTRKKPPPRKLRDGYAFDLSLKVWFIS
jgi:serine/threonine protein kinase